MCSRRGSAAVQMSSPRLEGGGYAAVVTFRTRPTALKLLAGLLAIMPGYPGF